MKTEDFQAKRNFTVLTELPACCATCRHWLEGFAGSPSLCMDPCKNKVAGFRVPSNGCCDRWVPIRFKRIVVVKKRPAHKVAKKTVKK